jgi:hypothetical protein
MMPMPPETYDPVPSLRSLQPLSPEPIRAERVRARCHAQLQRTHRSPPATPPTRSGQRLVGPAIVGCICVVYIADLIAIALRSVFY